MESQQDERAVAGQRIHLPHLHRRAAAHMILLASLLSSLECMVRREGHPWRRVYYYLCWHGSSLTRTRCSRSCLHAPKTRKQLRNACGEQKKLASSESKGAALAFCLGIRLCRFRLRRTRFGARNREDRGA
jgi:hypothetical protein